MKQEYLFETLAIRQGHHRTVEQEHAEPIFPTSSYVFDSAEQAAERFAEGGGNIYSRFTNPTVNIFQERLASLEGGECCIATSSGMAAILSTCMALLSQGDHLIASASIFGSTVSLFEKYLSRFGITISFVTLSDINAWQQAIQSNTRLLYLETPSNPLTEIGDIKALAKLAHNNNALLVVDNCFCTPVLQKPLEMGADIVIHSASKFLDGQGRAIGGAVIGNKELVGKEVFGFLRTAGPTMSPFNAWIFLKGLETLSIRMQAHSQQALALATWLEQQEKIEKVYYPGLPSHPQHALAMTQQKTGGGVVSFIIKGGRKAAWELINHTKLLSITANLGDVKTTITHPASTTHSRLTPQQRQEAGIEEGLIRIAVGLENIQDIINDLKFSI